LDLVVSVSESDLNLGILYISSGETLLLSNFDSDVSEFTRFNNTHTRKLHAFLAVVNVTLNKGMKTLNKFKHLAHWMRG
jgi:hypothetical protein